MEQQNEYWVQTLGTEGRSVLSDVLRMQLSIVCRGSLPAEVEARISSGTLAELVLWARRIAAQTDSRLDYIFAERIADELRTQLVSKLTDRFGPIPVDVKAAAKKLFDPAEALKRTARGDELERIVFGTIAMQCFRRGFLEGYLETRLNGDFGIDRDELTRALRSAPLDTLTFLRDGLA